MPELLRDMDLWRVSKFETLNGEGGRLAKARWNNAGLPIVYLAASAPGALWEVVVHFDLSTRTVPAAYTLLRVEAPDNLPVEDIHVPRGPAWQTDEEITRRLGDEWLRSKRTALARVPSVLFPDTWNYLLNPLHAKANNVRIADAQRVPYDTRFVGMLQR